MLTCDLLCGPCHYGQWMRVQDYNLLILFFNFYFSPDLFEHGLGLLASSLVFGCQCSWILGRFLESSNGGVFKGTKTVPVLLHFVKTKEEEKQAFFDTWQIFALWTSTCSWPKIGYVWKRSNANQNSRDPSLQNTLLSDTENYAK